MSMALFSQENTNKAEEIIKKVYQNKGQNATKHRFKSFEYTNYNKVIFSAYDSLVSNKIAVITDYRLKSFLKTRADSTSYKFKQQIKSKHFFIAEKLSKYQFSNNREKETILAIKMAGFKEPIYEFIALGVTKIDYYSNKLNLLGIDYVSPLAKKGFKDYHYTLKENSNTNYVIHFKSKKRKKSVGLEGVLYIDKKSFALTKVETNINGKVNVTIHQDFVFLKEYDHWFKDKTKIILRKGKLKSSIKAFRVLIGFRPKYSVSEFNPEEVSFVQIESKNDSVKINKPIKIKRSDYAITIDNAAINRKSIYWQSLLSKDLSKEKRTYQFLDSVVESRNIEKKLIVLRKLTKAYFTTKVFDIDLGQVIHFNNKEGFRLGFGGSTNDYLSSKIRLNGYAAYGFKDKKIKYKYGIDFRLNKKTDTWIGASFSDDIYESGKPKLLFDDPYFTLMNPRRTNISLFYNYKVGEVYLNHEFTPYLTTKSAFSTGSYQNLFDYSFISRARLVHDYNLTNFTFALEWTPFSKYITTPRGKFSVKKEFPKFNAEITKSFDNVLDGDFNYTQLYLKAVQEFKTIKSGSTQLLLKAGYTFGEAPYSHLNNHLSNHSLSNPWLKRINLSGTDAFETMLFNEFMSDKYVTFQVRQNFENFRIGKKFKPKLSFVTRYAMGTIKNPINHRGVTFKRLDKGYFESGLVLNQLFYGLGVSGFYRYGPYNFNDLEDNIAVKVTYVIGLF